MSALFNLDNPIWRFMGKLVDVCILTILWFVCSFLWIPIVTMTVFGESLHILVFIASFLPAAVLSGPSTTAVYYVTLKLVRDEESYTTRSFFKSFRENFKQGCIIGAIM
ncbi:MAG: YesL family protein, partial [Parasporobacterium sp.]|nr:YesL family protein [Parasporobacterium sp.]